MPNPAMGVYDGIYDWYMVYNLSTWETSSQMNIWMYNGIYGIYTGYTGAYNVYIFIHI